MIAIVTEAESIRKSYLRVMKSSVLNRMKLSVTHQQEMCYSEQLQIAMMISLFFAMGIHSQISKADVKRIRCNILNLSTCSYEKCQSRREGRDSLLLIVRWVDNRMSGR